MAKIAEKRKNRVGAAAETEAVTPKVAARRERQAPPPKIDESPMFYLTHHPERYHVQGGRVVPALGKLKLQPGINGVEERAAGEVYAQSAIDTARENGLVVIEVDVDGPGTSYLVRPQGTRAVLTKWERVYPGSTQIDSDEAGYVAWCAGLVTRGILPPAPTYILERMLAAKRKELEALPEGEAGNAMRKRLRSDLDAIEGELQREPVASEPVTPGVA